jgi:hypothetical protein
VRSLFGLFAFVGRRPNIDAVQETPPIYKLHNSVGRNAPALALRSRTTRMDRP